MIPRIARVVTLCCGIVTVLAANPSESHALCGLFDCLFGGCRTPTTTYFAPSCSPCGTTACSPCATTACSPCATGACGTSACSPCSSTVCNYMPQTCFRAQCVNVPVTTFRCVSACDPCTGCPTTVMRPTTTFVRQVRYVPFTTFRPVCNTVMSPVATVPAVVTPTVVAPAPMAPSSSCCSAASATISGPTIATPAPATTYAVPGPGPAPVIQSTPAIPVTPAPSLNSTPIQPLPRTDLKPVPDNSINGSSSGSSWTYDPDSRTTRSLPRPRDEEKSDLVVPAVYSAPAKSLDDGGWRAARR